MLLRGHCCADVMPAAIHEFHTTASGGMVVNEHTQSVWLTNELDRAGAVLSPTTKQARNNSSCNDAAV